MALKRSPAAFNRRRSDREDWEQRVDELAQQLCSARDWQQYFVQQHQPHRNTMMLPVWRKHRGRALRIAQLQRILPMTRSLPLRVTAFLSDILLK